VLPYGVAAWCAPGRHEVSRSLAMLRSSFRLLIVAVVCVALGACGGSSGATISGPTTPTGGGSPSPSPSPSGSVVTVTATGVSPLVVTIPVGGRVTFTNADTRPHDFSGGPDPSRPECPEIDAAGFVVPGQSRQTDVFTMARTCEYHDHAYIGVAAFSGRIVVQ
jgi:plastocyanin